MAKNTELETLRSQVVALTADVAALKAKQPPEPKNLTLDDLKVYGHQRAKLPPPDESWLPSWQECADLALIVEKSYPYLVTRSDAWLVQFRRALLALGNTNRASEPNNQEWGRWIGEWLEDHLIWDGVGRGPFLAAIAASGDIVFSGFGERDALQGIVPKAGLAQRYNGTSPDKMAWKKVLSEKRLTGEAAAAAEGVNRFPGRHENPRSSVQMLPQYDRK